jgi:hypothetical protein
MPYPPRVPTRRRSAARRPFAAVALVAVILALIAGSAAYTANGYAECTARGNSALWCMATAKWQSLRALF